MKKKVTTGKKLSFDKETVARLGDEAQQLQGGAITIDVSKGSCGCMSTHRQDDEDLANIAAKSCCEDSCRAAAVAAQ